MLTGLEVGANAANALSIYLAARNSIHTWWIGIVGCVLFGAVFYVAHLYADTLLQVFFAGTSLVGWLQWSGGGGGGQALPVSRVARRTLAWVIPCAVLLAAAYGYALWRLTDAYAPFVDSLVLTLSVAAQLLLVRRKYESWWFWLAVDTLSVTLFSACGLWLTAGLYAAFWINAVVALRRWRQLLALP